MPLSAIFSIRVRLSKILFFPVLFMRIYLGVRASRLIYCWLRLELNMLRVLPMIVMGDSLAAPRGGLKYFLIQACGSRIFLFRVLYRSRGRAVALLTSLALGLKLGVAPMHLWFIRVLRYRSYEVLVLLSTVQKILPLYLLSLTPRVALKVVLSGVRALVGA